MVYAKDLKSFASNGLWVRVPPRALFMKAQEYEMYAELVREYFEKLYDA